MMLRRIWTSGLVLGALLASVPSSRADFLFEADANAINKIDTVTGAVTPYITTNINSPLGLAFGVGGNLYVSNNGTGAGENTVSEFSSTGAFITSFGSTQLNAPQGLAIDSIGNVYVANASGTIDKYTSGGSFISEFSTATTGLVNPYSIAFDSANNLYVADFASDKVVKLSSTTGAILASTTANLDGPDGITVGGDGKVYVSNYTQVPVSPGNFIDRITTYSSSTLAPIGEFASGSTSSLSGPGGLALQPGSGNLYVVNQFTGDIEVFSPTGFDYGVLASGLATPGFIAFQPTAVPEPASLAMLVIGIGGCLAYNRGRSSRRSVSA